MAPPKPDSPPPLLRYASVGTRNFGSAPFTPKRRHCWEFYAVHSGRIGLWRENEETTLASNTLWLLPPESVHGWRGEKGPTARVTVFHFDSVPPELARLTEATGYFSLRLNPAEKSLLYHGAKNAVPELWEVTPLLTFQAQRLLMDLTLLILRKLAPPASRSGPKTPADRVRAAENWYRANLSRCPSIFDLSCGMGTTMSHLRRLFQQERGCSPKKAITAIQINHARELLRTTDLKLEAVAAECGYASASNLCQVFQNLHRMTPTEYRQSLRESLG